MNLGHRLISNWLDCLFTWFLFLSTIYSYSLDLCSSSKPAIVTVQGRLADGVQLVKESRDEASGTPNKVFGCGILGCNFVHQKTGEHSKELIRLVRG